MLKAIFLDYTGTITQENCKAVREVVTRIVGNSALKTPGEALTYWWSNLRRMEETSYLDTFMTEDEIVDVLLKRCEDEIGLKDNTDELHRLFQDFWTYSPVYPDAKEFFEKCCLPIYILTNNGSEYVQECMRINGLRPAGIISGDMVKAYKPHRELFERALRESGCEAGEVWHVGDSVSSDVEGALNAGITPVLLDREGKERRDSVKTVRELTDILDRAEYKGAFMDHTIIGLPSLEIKTWTEESLANLVAKILKAAPRPLILIDGAGGSGKTTLAEKLAGILHANLVHTDDVSWYADPIHWDGEMLDGIVRPWLDGKDVAYRPSGWIKKNRPGSIAVDPERGLVVEGMGAGRKTLREAASYSIWVDTEPETARARVVRRDIEHGENGGTVESVTEFADWWDSLTAPFLLEEEAWKYVDILVSGCHSDLDSDKVMVHIVQA